MQTNIPGKDESGIQRTCYAICHGTVGSLGDVVKIEWLLIVTGIMLITGDFTLYGRKELIRVGEAQTPTETEASSI